MMRSQTPAHAVVRPPIVLDPERKRMARERGAEYLFIPQRIADAGRPKLANFPANIVFHGVHATDRGLESGQALYEPILESFHPLGGHPAVGSVRA